MACNLWELLDPAMTRLPTVVSVSMLSGWFFIAPTTFDGESRATLNLGHAAPRREARAIACWRRSTVLSWSHPEAESTETEGIAVVTSGHADCSLSHQVKS
jgi:hypothetical protein